MEGFPEAACKRDDVAASGSGEVTIGSLRRASKSQTFLRQGGYAQSPPAAKEAPKTPRIACKFTPKSHLTKLRNMSDAQQNFLQYRGGREARMRGKYSMPHLAVKTPRAS